MTTSLSINYVGDSSDFKFIEARPGITMVLLADTPHYTILAVSNDFVTTSGRNRDEVVGKSHFTIFPENPAEPSAGAQSLLNSFDYTLRHKTSHSLPITRYDIPDGKGGFMEKYWRITNAPVFNERGEVEYVIHTSEDVAYAVEIGVVELKHRELEKAYRIIEESQTALQGSVAKYRNLFDFMGQGYCTIELIYNGEGTCIDYRYLEINPAFEKQSGIVDAVGKTVREVVPGIEPYWFELYGNVAKTGSPNRFIEEASALNKWYEIYAVRVGGDGSNMVGVFFTDVTEHKKGEDALRQSESNLRNTILQAPVAICIFRGPEFVVEIANDKMYELMGRGKEEVLGRSIFVGMPEVSKQGYEELLTDVYTTGKRYTANGTPVTLPREGGMETVYINLLYEPFRDIDGTISGVIAVASDVSEQVLATQKVVEANKEFQFITDFMPQLIWVTRPDGYHYYYNKQWYDYTGLTYEETEGEGWNSVFHPDDQQRAWKVWRQSLQTGEPYEIEYRCKRHDGEYRWFLGRALPLKDEEGKITKWFGTCTDIDDQRRAAEIMEHKVEERTNELQKANQELSRSNQNLEEFAYAASHDLKEPMRKIQMFSGRLSDRLAERLDEEEKGYISRITRATDRMNTLIDDLLMYSHVSRGAVLEETIDLNQKVSRVLEDLEVEIEEQDAVITVDPLPTIKGHRRQVQQLFQNLIGNAVKYHKPGVPPAVHISCHKLESAETVPVATAKPLDQYYLIEIRDNGIGFGQEDAERIFNVFTRLHGNTEYKGTGVGLSIVRKVVENHGGYIWAESKPDGGSTFRILLPAD
jgi:PAS domain S-box-containing protein